MLFRSKGWKKRRAEGKARRAAPNGGFGAYGVLTGAFIGTCLQRRSFEEILLIGSTGVQGFVLTSAFQFEDIDRECELLCVIISFINLSSRLEGPRPEEDSVGPEPSCARWSLGAHLGRRSRCLCRRRNRGAGDVVRWYAGPCRSRATRVDKYADSRAGHDCILFFNLHSVEHGCSLSVQEPWIERGNAGPCHHWSRRGWRGVTPGL